MLNNTIHKNRVEIMSKFYQKIRRKAKKKIEDNKLQEAQVEVGKIGQGFSENGNLPSDDFKDLAQQNFKLPSDDYALAKGEEVLLRCKLGNSYGDAFTNKPKPFRGKLGEIFDLDLENETDRAIFFSALNAAFNHLDLINKTIHCQGNDPKKCGRELVEYLQEKYGKPKIVHIGYQPGHLEYCCKNTETFVTDRNPENIGKEKFGTKILSATDNERTIKKADLALITGSSVVNGSLPQLVKWCEKYNTKPIIYGVSGKSASEILEIESFCPYGRENPS